MGRQAGRDARYPVPKQMQHSPNGLQRGVICPYADCASMFLFRIKLKSVNKLKGRAAECKLGKEYEFPTYVVNHFL